jgi:ATP-dependent exoDNAse (exonuclease V) alpha subunit
MDALFSKAYQTDSKVVLIGDTKQLQAVDAGNMFTQLQNRGIVNVAVMDDVVRQANSPDYLNLINEFSSRRIDDAFTRLQAGKLTEINDRDQRLEAITKEYVKGDYASKILVVSRNTDRNEINSIIRNELRSEDRLSSQEYSLTVRESKGINPVDKHFSGSYQVGDIIYAQKAGVIGRAGTEARVASIDQDSNSLHVETSDGSSHKVSLIKDGDKISAYTEKSQSFGEGDKVVFLKNDKLLGVSNGSTGIISRIGEHGSVKAKLSEDKEIIFNTKNYPYINLGYAVTDYKSQGQTAKEVLVYTDTARSGSNYNSFYVALSRGKDDLHVYTDDAETLKEQVKVEQEKSSTLNHDLEQLKDHSTDSKDISVHSDQSSHAKESSSENLKPSRQMEIE